MECCEHITAVGLEEGERRKREVDGFNRCHEEACSVNQQHSVQRISDFEQLREKVCVHRPCMQWLLFNFFFSLASFLGESYRLPLTHCSMI